MARIRTLKPEFWTSEQITDCSPIARLLFVGIWSFADDNGIHPASVKRLKMEVFPSDDFTQANIAEMIQELIEVGLLKAYEVDGENFWKVTGWHHQKIDQPTYRHPLPDGSLPRNVRRRFDEPDSPNIVRRTDNEQGSLNAQRTFDERSPREGNGKEGKVNNTSGQDVAPSDQNGIPECPHEEIIALYHELLPTARAVRIWNDARKKKLRARWREDSKRQNLDWWKKFFGYIAQSDFLMGKVQSNGRAPFDLDLEWIVSPGNIVKIIEGKYHHKEAA